MKLEFRFEEAHDAEDGGGRDEEEDEKEEEEESIEYLGDPAPLGLAASSRPTRARRRLLVVGRRVDVRRTSAAVALRRGDDLLPVVGRGRGVTSTPVERSV